jgi:hypothetical protein
VSKGETKIGRVRENGKEVSDGRQGLHEIGDLFRVLRL